MSRKPHPRPETMTPDDALPWAVDASGGFAQGPLDLAFVADRRLDLQLGEGMVALLVRDGHAAATWLPGRHLVNVDQGGQLLFLATGAAIELRWPEAPASPVPAGECRLRIAAPLAFHDAFLRHAERIGEDFLRKLMTTLVLDRARVLLAEGRPAAQVGPDDLAPVLAPMGLSCLALRLAVPSRSARTAVPATATAAPVGAGLGDPAPAGTR